MKDSDTVSDTSTPSFSHHRESQSETKEEALTGTSGNMMTMLNHCTIWWDTQKMGKPLGKQLKGLGQKAPWEQNLDNREETLKYSQVQAQKTTQAKQLGQK